MKKGGGIGFWVDCEAADYEGVRTKVLEEVKRLFNPEFINRVDEPVVFP